SRMAPFRIQPIHSRWRSSMVSPVSRMRRLQGVRTRRRLEYRGGVARDMTGSLDDLRSSLAGTVLTRADSEYGTARRCFSARVQRRPAVIVRCLGAGDVATALDYARTHELEVAVRGGGHNPAGHCVVDDGLVIDLSGMRKVEVDSDRQVAHAEGGATW